MRLLLAPTIAKLLHTKLKRKRLTLPMVSERTGLPLEHLENIFEHHTTTLTFDDLEIICGPLGIDPAPLLAEACHRTDQQHMRDAVNSFPTFDVLAERGEL
ncbi:hypothetical protein E4U03_09490 [Rothia nasimurium]|uniref:HTH cro/C1-type domain-containing protein n=1 Tax=Rothia nasimurium TaxID=85336 RepID=A0A4Y9F1Q0_9MICC|nr:hypothetical protein [Rothia nasimurium]MBF0808832.1 hypothetical protein [Rothia nasimurium]TFU21278.1 hypothetical protein E4U03_09490 [Rothia nasimurium]